MKHQERPSKVQADIADQLETFFKKFVAFSDPIHALVVALWTALTHCFNSFYAIPYLTITSEVPDSGKTTLLKLISYTCANPDLLLDPTPAGLFNTINTYHPTILLDEAEVFASSHRADFRALLNAAYTKGGVIVRKDARYEVFGPLAFALIGDPFDTMRSRSIIIPLRPNLDQQVQRFVPSLAQDDGDLIREQLSSAIQRKADDIVKEYLGFDGLPFLVNRERQIWTPLFVLCHLLCPHRIDELTRVAVDLAASKTAPARKYTELKEALDKARDLQYGKWLLRDLLSITTDRLAISTTEAITLLRELATSPWRTYGGSGLTNDRSGAMLTAQLLAPFGVTPKTIRVGPEGTPGSTAKGYRRDDLLEAARRVGIERS